MASTTEVEERLRSLIARLEASDDAKESLRASLQEPRVLWLHLPDLDADYWTELDDGGMHHLHDGAREDADVRITADSDELLAVIDGRSALVPSYLSGKIRIDASFSDMLLLRRMLA